MPLAAQPAPDSATSASAEEVAAGQDLIYGGRYPDARQYFSALSRRFPGDPAGPALQASALIWWAEALEDDGFEADSIDALLGEAAARGRRAAAGATTDSARVTGLFWLGTALGYRARQADLHGHYWGAVGDARRMRAALDSALVLDSACVDCHLGLAIYDYALARAGFLARLVAHLLGLDGGNVARALETMRRVGEHGRVARLEARWLYANALVRESAPGDARWDEARQVVSDLAVQFPDNPVFRRFLATGRAAP